MPYIQRASLVMIALMAACILTKDVSLMESVAHGAQPEKRQYYRSWASYNIPMRPVDPIDFKDTEYLDSFYLGLHDRDGRLVRFTKVIPERQEIGERRLAQPRAPNSVAYFELPPPTPNQNPAAVGNEIPYSATEGLTQYIKGAVTESGRAMNLEKVNRQVFFVDNYAYWPNGALKERIMRKEDGSTQTWKFDERGKELGDPASRPR